MKPDVRACAEWVSGILRRATSRCLAIPAAMGTLLAAEGACQESSRAQAGAWEIASEPVVLLGASEDAPLFQIGGAVQLSDGRLIVQDGGLSPRLSVFSAERQLISQIGREGDGPGEFRYISSLASDDGDSLFVFDRGSQRLTVYSPDGQYARSVTSRVGIALTGSSGFSSVERLAEGVWAARTPPNIREGGPGRIIRDTVVIGLVDGALEEFTPLAQLPGLMSTTSLIAGRRATGPAPLRRGSSPPPGGAVSSRPPPKARQSWCTPQTERM